MYSTHTVHYIVLYMQQQVFLACFILIKSKLLRLEIQLYLPWIMFLKYRVGEMDDLRQETG